MNIKPCDTWEDKHSGGVNIVFRKVCSVTNETYIVSVPREKYADFVHSNISIQTIFPELSADERELIISGITPAEWDKYIGNTELETDDDSNEEDPF